MSTVMIYLGMVVVPGLTQAARVLEESHKSEWNLKQSREWSVTQQADLIAQQRTLKQLTDENIRRAEQLARKIKEME